MAETFDLAVAGCTSLVGESFLEQLADSDLPIGRVYALDRNEAAGRKVEFRDRYLTVEPLDTFDFSRVNLAVFAIGEREAGDYVPRAAAAGCTVIDTSARFRGDPSVPLIVPGVNAEILPATMPGTVIAGPSPAAAILALALVPLQRNAGIERLDVTVCYPASASGRSGVEELASQTARLLNAQDVKPRIFRKQLSFNLLPQVGEMVADGQTRDERDVAAEVARLLGHELAIAVTAIQVPVFYGLSAVVHADMQRTVTADEATAMFAATLGLKVVASSSSDGYPTPVTEAARHDDVFVGRIRRDASRQKGLNFWIVADNVRKGAATNGIRLVEMLIRGDR